MFQHLNSRELKSAVIGMLLGDACLQTTGHNYRIRIKHCKKQLEYLEFKLNILKRIEGANPSIKEKNTFLKKTGKTYDGFELSSKSIRYFYKIHKIMYLNNKKNITHNLLNRLTPLGIAIWFMDDGYLWLQKRKNKDGSIRINDRKIKLATHCFSLEEQKIICQWLMAKYNISAKIYKPEPKKNPEQYAICLNATNSNKFIDLVKDYILQPLFSKKINMLYKNHRKNDEDIVCSATKVAVNKRNEMGSIAQKSIIGVQIVNVGSGFSIDDMTIDQAMTYVARKVTPWSNQAQIDKDTGNVDDSRSDVGPNFSG